MNRLLFTILSLMLYSELQHQAECSTAEQRENVINFLRGKSPPLVRPDGERGGGTPVVVNVKYSNIRVLDVDEERGIMRTNGYLFMTWTDPRLRFQHMMSYRGHPLNVTSVHMDLDSIWTPDIELYNSDSPGVENLIQKNLAILHPTGYLTWIPLVVFTSFCDPAVAENQTMTCTIRLGSWTCSVNDVDLQVLHLQLFEGVDVISSSPRGPWRLTTTSVQRVVKTYSCCPEEYVSVDYTFNFARR